MKLRPFLPNDADFFERAQDFEEGWTEEMVRSSLSHGRLKGFVWEESGVPVSAVIFESAAETADIECVYTLPAFRKRGLARALIESAVRRAKEEGAEQVFLEVREDNAPAAALYESLGFARAGERKKYYKDGAAAIVMVKGI